MDKPNKPRRPKPVIILSEEEKKQQEFNRKVRKIEREINRKLNTPEFLSFVNAIIDQRK